MQASLGQHLLLCQRGCPGISTATAAQIEAEQDSRQTSQGSSQKAGQLSQVLTSRLGDYHGHVQNPQHNTEDALISSCSR